MKTRKILITAGGTGGHIFPAVSLYKHLKEKNFFVKIITDKRGFKYLKDYKEIDLKIIDSATIFHKNPLLILFSLYKIISSLVKSIFMILKIKPNLIFGMGGYSSFPVCFAATILKIPFVVYENNLFIGKSNRYLLPLAKKIFVSHSSLQGINDKYQSKIISIGNIIRKEILNFENKSLLKKDEMCVLVIGGSQAARSFAEKLPVIFEKSKKMNINFKIYQQCLPDQKIKLEETYKSLKFDFELFNFTKNILEYYSKVNLVITRAGSSVLAELINCKIPFISIPLPSSSDNHQLKNAKYFKKNGCTFLIEETEIDTKLLPLIKLIHEDKSILTQMIEKQKKYSDKLVYKKLDKAIEDLVNEKY